MDKVKILVVFYYDPNFSFWDAIAHLSRMGMVGQNVTFNLGLQVVSPDDLVESVKEFDWTHVYLPFVESPLDEDVNTWCELGVKILFQHGTEWLEPETEE